MPSDKWPRRIVSLQPSATVILCELGKLDLLVAYTKYCVDLCPEVGERGMAIVADSWTAQAQQIREANPDFVIASVPYQEKAVIEILKAGIPFLALAPKNLDDIYSDIALIGRIVSAEDVAEKVIRQMQDEIETIRQSTKDLPKPHVFCEEWGKPLIASQPWVRELVEAAGGEFVGSPGRKPSFGEIEACQPDVIVAAWCGAGNRVPLKKIIDTRNWQNTPAARNDRVYSIRDEFLNTPAPTLVHGLHALRAAIHPEHFPQAEGLRCINSSR
jgi:iron complex transport system substrate-binding protein